MAVLSVRGKEAAAHELPGFAKQGIRKRGLQLCLTYLQRSLINMVEEALSFR